MVASKYEFLNQLNDLTALDILENVTYFLKGYQQTPPVIIKVKKWGECCHSQVCRVPDVTTGAAGSSLMNTSTARANVEVKY